MSLKNVNISMLDVILEKMINTVDQSKGEIFTIGEQCRQDYQSLMEELNFIRQQVKIVIQNEEDLEVKVKLARRRLSEVSKFFHTYTEEDVRSSYEQAHKLQMKLMVARQKEKQLIDRRNDLERRLYTLQKTIDRADHLVSQITVVHNYLTSDVKQIGEALEGAKEMQDFGFKIMEAQEDERKRLSREIHDGPAQMMANVLMRSDLIDKLYKERGVDEAIAEIRNLKQMVRSALYEVRRIIYDLRPMALDDLGLVPTLKKYLITTEEYSHNINRDVTISFHNLGFEKRLPSKLEIALFRLVQESVQNALKHSGAKHIQVKLEIGRDHVLMIIKDNGKGFDVSEKKSGSFGIMGMKERVELLEGEITIDSKLGAGTLIMINVPIK
ncbi:two-component system sensor histidine kinase DegS [Oikeobacillus pervagus]|uniref:Signal transduction histidine-protein kinase/phosphatase DegS n=1 Tax=Oikeobacillus pervagus TaxID=1325931 RepID=A0AAJ1SY82_9BACI|nr:sensor histidine kinase [Oikeobacillus pervagus]MDQ0214969.1 two-component system sensor histidine kinase DegS [Oikeobacillus pervagus]